MKLSEQQLYLLTNNARNAAIIARDTHGYHKEFNGVDMVQHYVQNIIRILKQTL